ncbi:uncharacterized protein K460DRAFT_410330 [Cucurbitaria berberidis CBS 394.84]|uniref:C2H2-type domain-containing protein n=1 Tax=Cucurbitaria berberidis CBS 394.84 TaxID=1168544 RepID=A0A9P4L446_9PLEO|nr:uncharacterized protein K460DRAFT_410330 [Cucurbitaria berberidis CBS 394.84]KAF1840937.1 hypothetical protein K460DRAFT_410330 [Cucurbitaria berberidis CBS 394.84]
MANALPNVVSTFEKSLNAFKTKAGLSPDELKVFQLTSLDDLRRQIAIIQDDQRKSKKMRYLKRLGPFLDTMEQYGKIVEVFLNISDIIAFIWGPMKFLLMVAKNYADAFNALLDAYLEIGENLPQFTQYQTVFQSNSHMQLALAYIYEDILEFHKEALRYFRQRTWKELFHATWRSFSNTVTHLSKNLHRHKSLIESQATIVQFEALQDLRTQSQRNYEEYNRSELDRKRLSVQQWLCPINAQTRHEDATKNRYGDSGDWLLKDPRFKKWYDFDYCHEPLLWLSGIPGAGKTVLTSRVIDECRKLPHAKLCFFYCRNTDETRNAFVSIARTMCSQLMSGNDMIVQLLYDRAAKSSDVVLSSVSTAKALLDTVLQTCDKTQKTYIIIDGLDEYNREDRKEMTTWFRELVRNVPSKELGQLRCLFISQDDGYARKDLSDCSAIRLKPEETRRDIQAYCQMWHQRLDQKFGPLDPKQYNISEIVTARAQGMFLYAKLVTENLYEQPTRSQFLLEMRPDVFPSGLEQAYSRIINRIMGPAMQPHPRSDHAKRLLGWLACAKRTLQWFEIQCAVSVNLEEGILSSDLKFQDNCKDLCASLVELSSEGFVVLVHSTAKKFLMEKGHICVPEVDFDLALLCMTYMSFDQFVLNTDEGNIQKALYEGDYAFADYASCFWAHHLIDGVRKVSQLTSRKLEHLVEAIGVFLDVQWASPTKRLTVSKTMEENLAALTSYDMYDSICQAVISTKNQLLPTGKGPSDDEPLSIAKVMEAIRTQLEAIVSSPSITTVQEDQLKRLYGSNYYKCRRLNCQFYSRGFPTHIQRDRHISKHERSFVCTEEGCPQAVIGCVTAKDLQKHMEEYHGTVVEADADYPEEVPEVEADSRHTQKQPTTFDCSLCSRSFTRAYNLHAHLRTHTNEKPFVCTMCGKSFVRQNDRLRHEGIHLGKGKYACYGNLKNGNPWGCGRPFARISGLRSHFRCDPGRACIRPLLEEQWREEGYTQDQWPEETAARPSDATIDAIVQASDSQATFQYDDDGNPTEHSLPEALLAQYPALADVQWDQLPPDPEEESY